MAEYYIRREGDDDASGPFDLDQLASLAELGKIDDTAFFYDMDSEQWRPITDSEEAMEALHPKKKKLSLQSKPAESESPEAAQKQTKEESSDKPESSGPDDETETAPEEKPKKSRAKLKRKKKEEEESQPKAVVVTEMLAQAEGREGDDPSGKSPREKRATAAYLGLITATFLLLVSALSMCLIELDLIKSADAPRMMQNPYIIVAIADLILAVFLILQVTEIYPLVRFKAALGFGFVTILFIASGDPMMALGNALICGAIYFATAAARMKTILITIAVGLAGAALYAMQLLPLFTGTG